MKDKSYVRDILSYQEVNELLTLADPETLSLILSVVEPYGVYPLSSDDAEAFFNNLLSQYSGPLERERLVDWLNNQLHTLFVSVGERPRWIQNPDWQFAHGKPMIFAGQIDISRKSFPFYHDDSSLYIFIASKEEPRVIVQQY